MKLKDYKIEELENELERRRRVKPKQLDHYDTEKLKNICEDHIKSLYSGERFKDPEDYIYKIAIETFYGPDIWDWINQQERNL